MKMLFLILLFSVSSNSENNIYFINDNGNTIRFLKVDTINNTYFYYGIIGSIKTELSFGYLKKTERDKYVLIDKEIFDILPVKFSQNTLPKLNYSKVIVKTEIGLGDYKMVKKMGIAINGVNIPINNGDYSNCVIKYEGKIKNIYYYFVTKNNHFYRSKVYYPKSFSNHFIISHQYNSVFQYFIPLKNDTIEFSGNVFLNWNHVRNNKNELNTDLLLKKISMDSIYKKYQFMFDINMMDEKRYLKKN